MKQKTLVVRLTTLDATALERATKLSMLSKSDVVRQALRDYLGALEQKYGKAQSRK